MPAGAPLALVASRVRYEEKRLLEAAERRRVPCLQADPRRLWIELTAGGGPGWGVALNREIAHTRGLYLARLLEAKGVPTVNPAAVAEVCGDKLLTSLALARAGLNAAAHASVMALPSGTLSTYLPPCSGRSGRIVALCVARS